MALELIETLFMLVISPAENTNWYIPFTTNTVWPDNTAPRESILTYGFPTGILVMQLFFK